MCVAYVLHVCVANALHVCGQESMLAGSKRTALMALLSLDQQAIELLLRHYEEFGDHSAFPEEAMSDTIPTLMAGECMTASFVAVHPFRGWLCSILILRRPSQTNASCQATQRGDVHRSSGNIA